MCQIARFTKNVGLLLEFAFSARVQVKFASLKTHSSEPSHRAAETGSQSAVAQPARPRRSGAVFVAAGIFLSRIAGLVRERVFAHFFGNSAAADAFKAAQKIPNFLQNLLGEGVLSASFIPVYARLLGEGNEKEADRVAGVIATLLALTASILAVIGVWLTPLMIDVIAPGFTGEKRDLTISLVQIFFPGVALLVMSAWCLGVLNSHRRFFLSYVAPVLSNFAIIAVLLLYGGKQSEAKLATTAAWGLVIGSLMQLLVQLPTVLKLAKHLKFGLGVGSENVRRVLGSFSSVVIARGVVQISAYIDNVLASWLPTGAVAALGYAQTIYLLPVSLFGMSVSAASLAEMSRSHGTARDASRHVNSAVPLEEEADAELKNQMRAHLQRGLKQIAFFIVPSTAAFVFLGDVIVSAIYQTGKFSLNDVNYVWITLAGSGVGLLASTLGRLYASTFYALQDPKTPLRYAVVRVALTTALGTIGGLFLPEWLGIDARWGTVGLTVTAGASGWIEFLLLRRGLGLKIGAVRIELQFLLKLWAGALIATLLGYGARILFDHVSGLGAESHMSGSLGYMLRAVMVFSIYGAVYFLFTAACGLLQSQSILRRLRLRI